MIIISAVYGREEKLRKFREFFAVLTLHISQINVSFYRVRVEAGYDLSLPIFLIPFSIKFLVDLYHSRFFGRGDLVFKDSQDIKQCTD